MADTTTSTTWLTQDAYDRLRSELDYLEGPWRDEIAKRIEAAREEGDLKENGGYHAAKEEQGKQESRIRTLTLLLRTAQVGDAPTETDGTVIIGSVVTAEVQGEDETFLVGSREIGVGTDFEVYSEKSPLGAAILGLKEGASTSYTAPNGREINVTVKRVVPFTG